jgi:peptidoglycan hydrolase-like protein with peptidoglycan-binding domain
MIISGSVGRGGANQAADVRLVQRLLNDARVRTGEELLVVDGLAGPRTNAAIELYQRRYNLPTDGRIDPTGPTLRHLIEAFWVSIEAGVVQIRLPSGNAPTATPEPELLAAMLKESLERLRS